MMVVNDDDSQMMMINDNSHYHLSLLTSQSTVFLQLEQLSRTNKHFHDDLWVVRIDYTLQLVFSPSDYSYAFASLALAGNPLAW